jgi:DNA-binding PadR family transcriptional regulator
MDVRTLCLGVLSFGESSGYGLRGAIGDWFGHFGQASLGAIYPALAKLVASGEIETVGSADAPLEKRRFRITEAGLKSLSEKVGSLAGEEKTRSPFLAGLFFAHLVEMDDVHRLVDERIAGLRQEQRRLRSLPMADLTEGQRFTIRYALATTAAGIAFMEREGRAIINGIARERDDL